MTTEDITHAIDYYLSEVDYLLKLPDYSDEDKAKMRARATRLAETKATHSVSPDTNGSWTCDCGASGFDVFDLASHFNVAAHLAPQRDPVALIDAHIPSITDEMDEDYDLAPRDDEGNYAGDKRVCRCGVWLDGFYEYADHLKEVLS